MNDKWTKRKQEEEGEMHGQIDWRQAAWGDIGVGIEEGTMVISGRGK